LPAVGNGLNDCCGIDGQATAGSPCDRHTFETGRYSTCGGGLAPSDRKCQVKRQAQP